MRCPPPALVAPHPRAYSEALNPRAAARLRLPHCRRASCIRVVPRCWRRGGKNALYIICAGTDGRCFCLVQTHSGGTRTRVGRATGWMGTLARTRYLWTKCLTSSICAQRHGRPSKHARNKPAYHSACLVNGRCCEPPLFACVIHPVLLRLPDAGSVWGHKTTARLEPSELPNQGASSLRADHGEDFHFHVMRASHEVVC